MKREEVMAIISSMEMQLAALKELVAAEEVVNENPAEETPVINEQHEERKELPAPPAEIYIDVVEKPKATPKAKKKRKEAPDKESVVGNQIISELNLDYLGKCDCITLQHPWYDNTGKLDREGRVIDTLYMEKHIVIITLEDINNKVLLTKEVHWDNLYKWHGYLLSKKISKGIPDPDPHKNGMPRKIHLIVGD